MQKLSNTQKLVRGGLLAAITILLAVTPLGYVRINPVLEITLMVVPVALGGLVIGWPIGTFLGLVFGVTSFIKAFTDPLGILMIDANALLACLGCLVPRLVVGALADLFHRVIFTKPQLRKVWFYAIAGFACSLCNTVLFLGFVWLAFDAALTGITFGVVVSLVVSNGLFEMAVNALLVALLARVLLPAAPQPAVAKAPKEPPEAP